MFLYNYIHLNIYIIYNKRERNGFMKFFFFNNTLYNTKLTLYAFI